MPDRLPSLYDRVRADQVAERGPSGWLRSRSTPARAAWLSVAAVALPLGAALLLAGPERILGRSPTGWVALAGLAVAAGASLAATLRPTYLPRWTDGSRRLLAAGVVLAALASFAMAGDGSLGALGGARCAWMGAFTAGPVFALALLFDRRPRRVAPFRALFAGVVAGFTAQVLCPAPGLTHLLVGHFGVVAAAALAFAAVGALLARGARSQPRM